MEERVAFLNSNDSITKNKEDFLREALFTSVGQSKQDVPSVRPFVRSFVRIFGDFCEADMKPVIDRPEPTRVATQLSRLGVPRAGYLCYEFHFGTVGKSSGSSFIFWSQNFSTPSELGATAR